MSKKWKHKEEKPKEPMYSERARNEPKCRINMSKFITRKICRNNCKQWNNKEAKCKLNLP